MDCETSDLPTSSRPAPAGQDSIDFKENRIEDKGCSVINTDITSSTLRSRTSQETPAQVLKKMQPVVESSTVFREIPKQTGESDIVNINNPHFYENWRNSFKSLLFDLEGRSVFYKYLAKDKHNVLLDCFDACEMFRTLPPKSDLYVSARDFYKRFIQFRDPKLKIREQTRSRVNHCMRTNSLHPSMFADVEQDVYSELRHNWYERFLDSDYFLNYCLSANQHLADDDRKSKGACMPTLHEEGMPDLRLERHGIGKEVSGKNTKSSAGLRRPLESCQYVKEPPDDLPAPTNKGIQECMINPDGTAKRERHKTREHQDYLPTLPHFKPRTERINREAMKPMKPEDFARILCEKLEKVIQQRAAQAERNSKDKNDPNLTGGLCHAVGEKLLAHDASIARPLAIQDDGMTVKSSCKSQGSYPQSDRYSAVGMSSVSGSEIKVENQLKYKHGAKELASAVHHALRTELKECQCQQCLEKHNIAGLTDHQVYNVHKLEHLKFQNMHCPCCLQNQQHDYSLHQRSRSGPGNKLTPSNLEHFHPHNPVDHNRIYLWMEQSEKYRSEMIHSDFIDSSHPSPAVRRRHRPPVIYDTTRPGDSVSCYSEQHPWSDPGVQSVHAHDTGVVLEEAKRRLEDNTKGVSRSSRRNGSKTSRPHHSHHGYMQQPVYAETSLSTTSGNWTLSDSASSASRQQVPSVVSSSIPSSASHFLNESTSDIPTESIKSQGSGNSKGNKKEKTIVTYFLGLEPIPYRTSLPGKNITLAQFKTLITKKGTFRYFFKTKTKDEGPVYQQVEDDSEYLPKFENKIVVKVEKVE